MVRILLLIEDYRELVYLQTLLKKIGFDVIGSQSLRGVEETQLGFNPEIVMISSSMDQNSLEQISRKMKARSQKMKMVFIQNLDGLSPRSSAPFFSLVDGHLKSPVNPKDLFLLIGKLAEIDGEFLVDKYMRMRAQLSADEETELLLLKRDEDVVETHSTTGDAYERNASDHVGEQSGLDIPVRNYSHILKALEPLENRFFDAKKVKDYHRKIRREESGEDVADLERERQLFVKELFKKSSGSFE